MALRMKCWLRRSAGQAVAVLILLSATGECLQCYWCGPLAEQVHRSQRAPSCDEVSNQETACDPGYTHCAVVATSPPFVESRYCVKIYQDECYATYCNSTKSYRMTCPCRGDLCNGPNTEREIDAFNALTKIVARSLNARIKRNAITSSNFINTGKSKMNNLIENDEHEENVMSNDTIDEANSTSNEVNAANNEAMATNNEPNETNDENTHNITQTEQTTTAEVVENVSTAHESEVNTTPKAQDEVKMVKSTTEASKEMPITNEIAITAESLKIDVTTTQAVVTTMKSVETIQAEVNEFVSNEIKPSMQLPTAEALQQNASPIVTTEKAIEQTTDTSTTLMATTENNQDGTPMPTQFKNNSPATSFSTLILIGSSLTLILSS